MTVRSKYGYYVAGATPWASPVFVLREDNQAFVARLNGTDGAVVWALEAGGWGQDQARGVALLRPDPMLRPDYAPAIYAVRPPPSFVSASRPLCRGPGLATPPLAGGAWRNVPEGQ